MNFKVRHHGNRVNIGTIYAFESVVWFLMGIDGTFCLIYPSFDDEKRFAKKKINMFLSG